MIYRSKAGRVRGRNRARQLLLLALLGLGTAAHATLTMPKIFNDNMVLQRNKSVKIWGWCAAGDTVTVTFDGQVQQAVADAAGRWDVELDPMPANAVNQNMTITTALGDSRTISNVLVGEVWLDSGQSNMNWALYKCDANSIATANADNLPNLRLFFVKCDQRYDANGNPDPQGDFLFSLDPLDDFQPNLSPAPQWVSATTDVIPWGNNDPLSSFSGPGYFFARRLQLELGVPVGMIDVSLGGSSIEPWCAPEGLAEEPNEWTYLQKRLDPAGSAIPMGSHAAEMGLYESFIHPIQGFTMRGFIWHQGEGNQGDCERYNDKLRALAKGWRKIWDDETLYMGVGQLYPYTANYGDDYSWVRTSWGQYRAGQQIPLSGSIVLNDHGTLGDIHPQNKLATGERYAAWARSEVYEQGNLEQGPNPIKARWDDSNSRVVIDFEYIGGGLGLNKGTAPEEFRVRCADDQVYDCTAQISPDLTQIWLSSANISAGNPAVMVEHAWATRGDAQPNVVNSENHPLTLFRMAVIQDFYASAITEQDAQVDTPYQADLSDEVTVPYYLDKSFTFRLVGAPGWLHVTESGMLYGTPDSSDLGANSCTVELDDGAGRVVSAALNIAVVAVGSPLMVGWDRGLCGPAHHKVAGVDAVFLGGTHHEDYVSNPTDGTWGGQSMNPPAQAHGLVSKVDITTGFYTNGAVWSPIKDDVSAVFSITNNTGADLVLDGIYFDSNSRFGNMKSLELLYADGDLTDPTNTLIYSGNISSGTWGNHNASFNGKLTDNTLAGGESATFIMDLELKQFATNQIPWSAFFMDNVMIRFSTQGTKGNLPPLFTANYITAPDATNGPYAGTISGSAVDLNSGDVVSYVKLDGPSWLTIAPDGSLSGTPGEGHDGLNRFKVAAVDSSGATASSVLVLEVNGINDPPAFTADPFFAAAAYVDQAYSGTIAGSATDPEHDVLTYTNSTGGWLTIGPDGTLGGTPQIADVGTNAFTVVVDDGNGASDSATLKIVVRAGNSAPVFNTDPISGLNATVGRAYSATLAGSATDIDEDPLTYSKADTGLPWLAVAGDGTLSGTPSAEDMGTDRCIIQVADDQGGSSTADLQVTVYPAASGSLELLVGWDSFDGISWGGGTAAAPVTGGGASGSMTATYGNGASGGSLSTVSWDTNGMGSTSGSWGGTTVGPAPSTQGTDGSGNYLIRSSNGSGTSYEDLNTFDITINAGTNGLVLSSLVVDAWKEWSNNNVGFGLKYQGGDLGVTNTNSIVQDAVYPSENLKSTSTPGVNTFDLRAFGDHELAAGETATFRLYAGTEEANGFYLDNFAILGTAAGSVSPLIAWKSENFTPAELGDPAVSGDDATPMNDGIQNLVKYLLNLDPWTAGGIEPGWPEAADWIIGFDRNAAATDADLYLEMIDDLTSTQWLTIAMSQGGAVVTTQNGATVVQDTPGTTNGVQVSVPLTTNAFFRFRAQQP